VADACPESAVIFIGTTNPDHYEVDVDLVKEVKRLAKPLQYKRVFFIEKTHNIEKYYQASDIFVMPSLREGLPNAMLEAMSCELPVIVSQLEGMTDWVVEDGVNSLLISPGSGIELSEKIIHLLNNADLSIAIGKEARKTILKRFTIEDTAKQYNILYTSMG
jgi:glycosyltransferase involved in cell wall biosynthesis